MASHRTTRAKSSGLTGGSTATGERNTSEDQEANEMELEIGSQTARHRSSTPASQYSRPPKELQPEKLSPYEGKSVRAHRDWTRSAENAFRLAPNTFGTEIAKISYAL
ncbi:hypothetical protein E6O75_ATG09787 [Venturia nashicola]|uniref:Uncharacterized protein n=1 Tax=Venturia nashicola TaxID=86259 RepID=A0A4Z1NQS2_9PEZI|nr:hypothetical protein E6O75_ATG09787 [Venturia nashicola]